MLYYQCIITYISDGRVSDELALPDNGYCTVDEEGEYKQTADRLTNISKVNMYNIIHTQQGGLQATQFILLNECRIAYRCLFYCKYIHQSTIALNKYCNECMAHTYMYVYIYLYSAPVWPSSSTYMFSRMNMIW